MTEDTEKYTKQKSSVGILFVHGIGEQNKGDTLLEFADPLVRWMSRSMDAFRSAFGGKEPDELLQKVVVEDKSPRELVLEQTGSKDKVVIRESWWAYNFRAPKIRALSWWLLLVGTYVTLSHASKPVIESYRSLKDKFNIRVLYSLVVAFFRLAFFYTPAAITFQVVVITLTLLAAIPLLPFSDGLSKILLTLSNTLGDSYLLNYSPIQRKMAIDNVRDDIAQMQKECDQVNVVAHSQGAAIAYFALSEMIEEGSIDQSKIQFVSIGSGLDKLSALDELSSTLEFSRTNHPPGWVRVLYYLPAGFALFWAVSAAGFANFIITLPQAAIIVSTMVVSLWIIAFRLYQYMPHHYKLGEVRWVDIFASSDPVSNGRITGPKPCHQIINSRSLIADHTSYFSNYTDFFPILVKETLNKRGLDWIDRKNFDQWIEDRIAAFGWIRRSVRKTGLMIGNWVNRLGFLCFLFLHSESLPKVEHSNLISIAGAEINTLLTTGIEGYLQIIWVKALLIFFTVHFFLRWADFSADRSADNMFFKDDWVLTWSLRLLTGSLVTIPTAVWAISSIYF